MTTSPGLFQKATPVLLGLLLVGFSVQSWFLHRLTRAATPSPVEADRDESETPPPAAALPTAPQHAAPAPSPHWGMDEWNPFEEMNRMREEMDSMFGRMFGGMNLRPEFDPFPRAMMARQPRMDIRETPEAYKISLEFPGADRAEIETEVRGGQLHVSARLSMNAGADDPGGRLTHTERFESRFHRSIPLPGDADPYAITSEYENGVLHINLPRRVLSARDTI